MKFFNYSSKAALALIFLPCSLTAAEFRVIEAEKCVVTPGHAAPGFLWASGGGQVHEFWGEKPGDAIQFDLPLATEENSLKVGVRYSYNMHHYLGFRRRPHSVEGIVLEVDGGTPIRLTMPETGDWHIYKLLEVTLPRLAKGTHRFVLRSTAAGAVRNIDCFVFYNEPVAAVPAWLRSSVAYVEPSGKFWVLASPGTEIGPRIRPFVHSVNKAWSFYTAYYGHEGPKPLRLHVIANDKWDNPGATAYQNNAGLFFPEGSFDKDIGNILHELTHHFNVGRLPGWFDEPMVRALTTFVWLPKIHPVDDPMLRERTARGKQGTRNTTEPLGTVDDVLSVILVEHGGDVFRRFWHSVHAAERQGKLATGTPLNRETIVQYLSEAAGKDVRVVFQRWPGFERARP